MIIEQWLFVLENLGLNKLSMLHPLFQRGPRVKYVLQLIINTLFLGKFPESREMDQNFPVSREVKNGQFWETLIETKSYSEV